MKYPVTRTVDVQDTLAGVSFPDPYRWLEEETEETRAWQKAQAELASAHVREWPQFERLRKLVAHYSSERHASMPRYAAGKWFRTDVPEGGSQARAVISDTPFGEGQVLFDTVSGNAEHPVFLSWIAPSPDGKTLALGICTDGSERNTIRLVDVASGRLLADPPSQTLMDNWTGGVQWLPDSSGFFFFALDGAPIEFRQRMFLHKRDLRPSTVTVDVRLPKDKEYQMVVISRDNRHALALERLGNPIPIAYAKLGKEPLTWKPFVTEIRDTVAGYVVGDRYLAVTDVGAPRGRVVAIPLGAQNPNDPDSWEELVPESEAALRGMTLVGNALYLNEFVDTYARVRIVDLNGKSLGEVPLPGRGAINELPFPTMNLAPKGHPDKFLFAFSTLTESAGIYSHTPGSSSVEVLRAPRVRLENASVEDRWAISRDGTRIPYHVVRRTDISARGPQPTLIYAYGGFNAPWVPQFPGPMAAFVAAGGVFVHGHLRGGAEFGRDWWEGGRMKNKQNCYDDLYAIAEDLFAADIASPRTLGVTGGSNGGLMSAVAVTQRPELWQAVMPRVPCLDRIGGCRTPYTLSSTTKELADVTDPDEVRRLATVSPYHLARDGVRYPAVFVDAGATDPRCPAWHSRKFAARMQAATAGDAPILVHIWDNVGHGWATEKETAITIQTEWMAFALRHLGVTDWSGA